MWQCYCTALAVLNRFLNFNFEVSYSKAFSLIEFLELVTSVDFETIKLVHQSSYYRKRFEKESRSNVETKFFKLVYRVFLDGIDNGAVDFSKEAFDFVTAILNVIETLTLSLIRFWISQLAMKSSKFHIWYFFFDLLGIQKSNPES